MFQSTPGIAAGRITVDLFEHGALVQFQSTPGIAAGRIARCFANTCSDDGFNPRPALLPGESEQRPATPCRLVVSIHARHCCRANRLVQWPLCHAGMVSIHARHCCRANPVTALVTRVVDMFQSTPGIAAGRIPPAVWHRQRPYQVSIHARHCCRANHMQDVGRGTAIGVSIHARHCCRANPFGLLRQPLQQAVSIHARHCCRANQWHRRLQAGGSGFQSTPGIAAGRISGGMTGLRKPKKFQSTPGIAAGRITGPSARDAA